MSTLESIVLASIIGAIVTRVVEIRTGINNLVGNIARVEAEPAVHSTPAPTHQQPPHVTTLGVDGHVDAGVGPYGHVDPITGERIIDGYGSLSTLPDENRHPVGPPKPFHRGV